MFPLPSRRALLLSLIFAIIVKFWPWEQWLAGAALPPAVAEMPAEPRAREAALRSAVRRLDAMGPIFTRGRTDSHLALAEIEGARGRRAAEADLRITALRAGPAPIAQRLAAASALVAAGEEPRRRLAEAMLADAERFAAPSEHEAIRAARQAANLSGLTGPESRRALAERGRVLLLALGRLDPELPDHVAAILERELGARVEVVVDREYLPLTEYRIQQRRMQYRDRDVIEEVSNRYRVDREAAPTLATLAVIDRDLYGFGLNFVWASAHDGLSLISADRLADPDDPAVTRARVAKQAVTSVLDWLGAPRPMHPACVNGNVRSVEEFDAKSDTICAETRFYLGAAARSGFSGSQAVSDRRR